MSAYIHIADHILRINKWWPWPRWARALAYETDEILSGGWQPWSTNLVSHVPHTSPCFRPCLFPSVYSFPRRLIQTCHRRARCWPSTMLPGMKRSALGHHVHQWLRLLRFQLRHQACRPRMKRPADMKMLLTNGKWRVYTINRSNRSCPKLFSRRDCKAIH